MSKDRQLNKMIQEEIKLFIEEKGNRKRILNRVAKKLKALAKAKDGRG